MDHNEAIRAMAAEKYLLDELTPESREQFEEHFFVCDECAVDLRAGKAFVEHSKAVLGEAPAVQRVIVPSQKKAAWLAWFRPAFAVPVLTTLLLVIGYQNFEIGRLKTPEALAATFLTSNTRGGEVKAVDLAPGRPFLIQLEGFADPRFNSYVADFYSPADKVVWSVPISSEIADGDVVPLRVPALRSAGTYTVRVRGLAKDNTSAEVGSYRFALKVE